jgi:hypothetical protein
MIPARDQKKMEVALTEIIGLARRLKLRSADDDPQNLYFRDAMPILGSGGFRPDEARVVAGGIWRAVQGEAQA